MLFISRFRLETSGSNVVLYMLLRQGKTLYCSGFYISKKGIDA
jgi:hypothetical protein